MGEYKAKERNVPEGYVNPNDPYLNNAINILKKNEKKAEEELTKLRRKLSVYETIRSKRRKENGKKYPCPQCYNDKNNGEVEYYGKMKIFCPSCRKIYTEEMSNTAVKEMREIERGEKEIKVRENGRKFSEEMKKLKHEIE